MHYKSNNKESKTYVQGLRPFGKTLPHGLKNILKKNGYNYSEIINKWQNLVGSELSKCCYPKSIKMNRGNSNGTLIIFVKRGNELTVEYSRNNIINKINSYFGYKLIGEIKLKTSNSEIKKKNNKNMLKSFSKSFENKINRIKNDNIRNSLSKLLDAIKND